MSGSKASKSGTKKKLVQADKSAKPKTPARKTAASTDPASESTNKSKAVKKETSVPTKKVEKKPAVIAKSGAAAKVQDKLVSGKKPLEGGKSASSSSSGASLLKSSPMPIKVEPRIIETPEPEFKARPLDTSLFSKDELETFRKLLIVERGKILVKAKRAMEDGGIQIDKNEMFDEVDQAAAMIDQNLTFRLLDRDRKLLAEIDHALAKIETGDFGYCEGTGEPIPKRRLELRPWCRHSVKFKEKLERMKKSGRGVVDEDEI